ncbi:hypothetical protein D3C86_1913170 [compost metagenome]
MDFPERLALGIRLLFAVAVGNDAKIGDFLALLFEDQHHVDGAATCEAHQQQFHRPHAEVLAANLGRAVGMYFYFGGTGAFEMEGVIYAD